MTKIIEEGYIGDTDYYVIECEECEQEFTTTNPDNDYCSKKCCLEAKADI